MERDFGAMSFSAEETQWRRDLGEVSDVTLTWHRRGQGLGAVDLGAELLPYRS